MDKFEQKKEMKKIRTIKNTWYDSLINYIPEPIRNSVGRFKNKIVSLSKTNIPTQTVHGTGKKLRKPKTQNKIKNIRCPFTLRKRNYRWNSQRYQDAFRNKKRKNRKKEINDRLIKDRAIRDIRTLFEQEKDKYYYKPKRASNFWNNNYIRYKSNGDKNRNLSLDEYLNKIKPYLSNIVIDLKNSYTQKIQLTMAINLFLQKMLKKSV